jgi:predicted dehydrogenase
MIKTAVIGCGYWGPNIVRALHEDSKWDLRYCCDRDAQKFERIVTQYSGINMTCDYDVILNDPEIEAVFVATPLASHYELVKKSLLAKKATFVEKPFVTDVKQGEELNALAHKSNLPLMVGHIFEYAPAIQRIKELLDKGEIGDIYYISAIRVNLGIHRGDGSVIWDLASHDLGTMFYWDILVNIQVSWLAPSKLRNTVIVGSEKMIVYDDTEQSQKLKIFDKGVSFLEHTSFQEFQLSYRTGDIIVPVLPNVEPLKVEINHFYECIKNGTIPRTNGDTGLRVVKYLDLAERSLKNNGEVIMVNGG